MENLAKNVKKNVTVSTIYHVINAMVCAAPEAVIQVGGAIPAAKVID
jgi:hypothetical protein